MNKMTQAALLTMVSILLAGVFMVVTSSPKESSGEKTVSEKLAPQTTCPVMGGAINKELYVDHEGKRIYVCCAGCIDAIKKDPEAAIEKLHSMGQDVEIVAVNEAPAEKKEVTTLQPQEHCPVMTGSRISKKSFVDYKGKRIYVCCGGCITKVKADPEKYLAVLEKMGEMAIDIPQTKE